MKKLESSSRSVLVARPWIPEAGHPTSSTVGIPCRALSSEVSCSNLFFLLPIENEVKSSMLCAHTLVKRQTGCLGGRTLAVLGDRDFEEAKKTEIIAIFTKVHVFIQVEMPHYRLFR